MPRPLLQQSSDLTPFWLDILQSDLSSTIVIALVTAFAGAFAGALGAQRIAEHAKSKEGLISEIRNNNAGISLAYSIFNSFYALKEQLVAPLKNNFDAQKLAHEQFREQRRRGEGSDNIFRLRADFITLQLPVVPIEHVQAVIFEQLSVTGRELNLASVLMQTIQGLKRSIEERNELIRTFRERFAAERERSAEEHGELARLYFGLSDADGNVDANYPMYVDAIYRATDDCIYFSKILIEDLVTYGKSLTQAFKKQFRGKPPKIKQVDFSDLENQGLMPLAENYPDWDEMFKKKS